MERVCKYCQAPLEGRTDKLYCNDYCKSAYHYQKRKDADDSLFKKIDTHLKTNRRILKLYNKAGKSTVRKQILIEEGFNPKYFTHYWKNTKGQVYLFCYEFGFLLIKENKKDKYVLIKHQEYMR